MAQGQMLARGLGLFSLGLGLYQLLAPREFSETIGVRPKPERETTARAVGARELLAAAGLLTNSAPAPWMWMRVAGDVMDLALLGRVMNARDTRNDRVGLALASVVGITALDLLGSVLVTREAQNSTNGSNGSSPRSPGEGWPAVDGTWEPLAAHTRQRNANDPIVQSVTIRRPRSEVYAFWRDFERLPQFMHHLESVQVQDGDGRRSHWVAKAPLGMKVEWDAELVDDQADRRIAWQSVEGSQIRNAGAVEFEDAPDGRGTVVRVELTYDPPGGPLGAAIAKLTGEEPATQTSHDLRRFKQVMETGEVVVSDATVGGRRLRQRPAQPLEAAEAAKAVPATVGAR
jgi:uncharacterized membrane protein